ncbi:putative oxalocrotonate tautomerase enzyme-domain-containing protein [Pestalotiopsis sp. NC0098]|nr:putative oxalocrotonate tautomerase enzyme-domain-containing protein [Pestalotiopsis sp. NC0098]
MPKWVFHHTVDAFSAEEKREIAEGMTKIYSSVGLPPFYSNTHFIEFEPENIYCGGVPQKSVTTIAIYHANPKPKGIKWESAIYEGDIEHWRINGLIPPAQGSEMEKKWFDANAITDEEELFLKQPRP